MRAIGNDITITVNNTTLCYNDEGKADNPTLIFIHGFPFTKSTWDKQAVALKEHYRVISFDIRGYGNSAAGNEEFSMQLFAEDLVHLMDILQIPRAAICGLSMGGYIALNAVSRFPERFSALILSNTQCAADSPETKEKRRKTIEMIREYGTEKYASESVKNLFAPASLENRKEDVEMIRNIIARTSADTICNTLLALAARDETCSRLEEIKVPVLILTGKEDKVIPPAASQLMHEKINDSELHIIEGAGHLSNIENTEAFNGHLLRFLSEKM